MLPYVSTVDEISQVIAHAAAPSFLLGAVAAFVSVLIGRLNRIVDRCILLAGIPDEDVDRKPLKADIPRLKRRARLMNKAIEYAVVSGFFTSCLLIVAFVSAFLHFRHEYGAGIMFLLALGFFSASLFNLWREVRAALNDLNF